MWTKDRLCKFHGPIKCNRLTCFNYFQLKHERVNGIVCLESLLPASRFNFVSNNSLVRMVRHCQRLWRNLVVVPRLLHHQLHRTVLLHDREILSKSLQQSKFHRKIQQQAKGECLWKWHENRATKTRVHSLNIDTSIINQLLGKMIYNIKYNCDESFLNTWSFWCARLSHVVAHKHVDDLIKLCNLNTKLLFKSLFIYTQRLLIKSLTSWFLFSSRVQSIGWFSSHWPTKICKNFNKKIKEEKRFLKWIREWIKFQSVRANTRESHVK